MLTWPLWVWLVLGVGAFALVVVLIWFLVRRRKSHVGSTDPKDPKSSTVSTTEQKDKKEDKVVQNAGDQLGGWKRAVEERDTLLKKAYADIGVLKQYVPALAESDRLLKGAYTEIAEKDAIIKGLNDQITGLGAPEKAPIPLVVADGVKPAGDGAAEVVPPAEEIVPPPARPSRTPAPTA